MRSGRPKFQQISDDERNMINEKERNELAIKLKTEEQISQRINAARKGGRRLLMFSGAAQ